MRIIYFAYMYFSLSRVSVTRSKFAGAVAKAVALIYFGNTCLR